MFITCNNYQYRISQEAKKYLFQAKYSCERLNIPKIFHAFVCGADQSIIKELMERTKARISVPPPCVMNDEIVVSGEKKGVDICVERIMQIFNEKVNYMLYIKYAHVGNVTVIMNRKKEIQMDYTFPYTNYCALFNSNLFFPVVR